MFLEEYIKFNAIGNMSFRVIAIARKRTLNNQNWVFKNLKDFAKPGLKLSFYETNISTEFCYIKIVAQKLCNFKLPNQK